MDSRTRLLCLAYFFSTTCLSTGRAEASFPLVRPDPGKPEGPQRATFEENGGFKTRGCSRIKRWCCQVFANVTGDTVKIGKVRHALARIFFHKFFIVSRLARLLGFQSKKDLTEISRIW